jgi:hypothetical protein
MSGGWQAQVVESIPPGQLQLILVRDSPDLSTGLIPHFRRCHQFEVAAETVGVALRSYWICRMVKAAAPYIPAGSFVTCNACKEYVKDNFVRRQPR